MALSLAQFAGTRGQQHAAQPLFPNGSIHAGNLTLIFRVRRKSDNYLLKSHALLHMPARMTTTTEVRTAIYYTQGGPVTDTPSRGGVGMTIFTIQGHTGFGGLRTTPSQSVFGPTTLTQFLGVVNTAIANVESVVSAPPGARLPAAPGASSQMSVVDGMAAIKDLSDTIHAYFYPAGDPSTMGVRGATNTGDLQLEFLNLTAPVSQEDQAGQVGWAIHPDRTMVDIQQDARQPFLYNYTLRFAALAPLDATQEDFFVRDYADPQQGLLDPLRQMNAVLASITNGVSTITDACTQMAVQNVTGPISTFLEGCRGLGSAVGDFVSSIADKIRFPLYAQRSLTEALAAPRHSVTTLASAAQELAQMLIQSADPRSTSTLIPGLALIAGTNDRLTVSLNHESPQSIHLGTQTGGAQIAQAIQAQVRALTPEHDANASAYRDFTATYTNGQYVLSGGTKLSNAGSITVLTPSDPLTVPDDASATLGLGVASGGQERAGSAYPLPALALLRGLEQACIHLQGFPDYFADQLEAQDSALAALLPLGVTKQQIRGDQHMLQTRITPGDSLHAIAARVGSDWQTLALVNRLTYPYIIEAPTTLASGRVSSAGTWFLRDDTVTWAPNVYQGQRLDIVSGTGAGQSRRILTNTDHQLTIETAWQTQPNDTSGYAIRTADNPVQLNGQVTAADATTITDQGMHVVQGSQRGLTLVITTGPQAGERRQVLDNTATTFLVDHPWDVVPLTGSLYLLLGPEQATNRQKVVGELLSVPRPSAQAPLPLRSRLHDVSVITGQHVSVEEQLFGRDLLLDGNTMALAYDPARGDAVTIAALPNLRQALIHYIHLPLTELHYAPWLGSYIQEELGLMATLPLQNQLLASVQRTVRQDPRIASMGGAQLVTQGGRAVITFAATAINGSSVDRVTIR